MLKKLTVATSTKRGFIERKANEHICERNCWFMCGAEVIPKVDLIYNLNVG
jgi:hypothetical protein